MSDKDCDCWWNNLTTNQKIGVGVGAAVLVGVVVMHFFCPCEGSKKCCPFSKKKGECKKKEKK
jgi:hypothetical protein